MTVKGEPHAPLQLPSNLSESIDIPVPCLAIARKTVGQNTPCQGNQAAE